MKACIYNPYIDTLGGGERYTLNFAKVLHKHGFLVDIEWEDENIKKVLEKRFGFDLKGINFVSDIKKGDGYDLCFWVSDGSIPLMHSRFNIIHFQVPFHGVSGKSLINKMKLYRVDKIVCNSEFTKSVIDKEFGVDSVVIFPPVDTGKIKPKRKENTILYVGRFSKILQSKGQEHLIDAFKKIFDKGVKDWKLILAGGNEIGAEDFVRELKNQIEEYPIEVIESPDFKILADLYGKAKIFWSAAGFGKDEKLNPEFMEHFGITVVEAMSAGVVPIIFDGGGHKEIVVDGENGFLWKEINDLVNITINLIKNPRNINKLSHQSKKFAQEYDNNLFEKKVIEIIK